MTQLRALFLYASLLQALGLLPARPARPEPIYDPRRRRPRRERARPMRLANISRAGKTFFTISGASSQASSSQTWTSGKIYLMEVNTRMTGTPNTPTITGQLTWTNIDTVTCVGTNIGAGVNGRTTLFWALGDGTTGTITVNFGGQTQTTGGIAIEEMSNVNTTSPIVYNAHNSGSSTTPSVGMVTPSNSANAYYSAAIWDVNQTGTPGSGYTELRDLNSSVAIYSEFRADNDLTLSPTMTMAGTGNWAIIAIELKNATQAGTMNTGNPTGSTTSSGTVTKLNSRNPTGQGTSSGALTKLASHGVSGSESTSGKITAQMAKSLGGSGTSSGALTRLLTRSLGGQGTSFGIDGLRQVRRLLSGSLTSSGAPTILIVKVYNRALQLIRGAVMRAANW